MLLVLLTGYLNAQTLKLGKVSQAELQEKVYAADTTAPAAILYKNGKTVFKYRKDGFHIENEYEFRIKIYKKEGLDWGTFSVPYYTGYQSLNDDYVQFSDAVTYNLENGKIVKTKAGAEGRLKKKVDDRWSEASIVMPNVKVGSVIEFKYSLRSQDISDFPPFYFQYPIPVKLCSYNTEIPAFFQYKSILSGFAFILNTDAVVDRSFNYENEYNQSVNINYSALSRNYFVENLPALKDEPYVDNLRNYRSAVSHELEKTQFEGEKPKLYSTTWEAVALEIYKNEHFGKELTEKRYFETFINPYISAATTPTDKALAVFNYVKRTMSWDETYGYLTRKGVRQAFADKTGNVAEINLMLVAMLNHAGIVAYPVLTSTVKNGVAAFPSQSNFDYVIASATIDGKKYLLDATDKNSAPNILPLRDLNWDGWQIESNGLAIKVDLVPASQSKEVYSMQAKIDASGEMTGKIKKTHSDYYALAFREKYKGLNPDDYLQKLERQLNNIEISGYSADLPEDCALPVEERFDFKSNVEVIGGNIYFNPLFFLAEAKNPFVADSRELPVYFGFPQARKYTISIDIPAGYSVVSLPKPLSIAMPDKLGSFTSNVQVQQQKIQITFRSEINKAMFASALYGGLKAYYQNLIDAQNEKIVLKKT